jgi:uncharacterized protein (TIGR04141 family)
MDDALKQSVRLERIDVSRALGAPALLFIKRPRAHQPDWARFFDGIVDPAQFGRVSSGAAVVTVETDNRILAVSFGHGRFLLNPDRFEDRFGLKVCLNSIDEKAVRSIDKRSFDALLTQSRVQTSKAAPIGDFGLDIEQDLLRAATGKPRDSSLGDRMSGLDSLNVTVRAKLGDLATLLPRYLQSLRSTRYRRIFPWVDQIAEIRSTTELDDLNQRLLKELQSSSRRNIWMALPEVVDWGRVHGFRYSTRRNAPLHYDIHIEEWLEDIGSIDGLSIEFLFRKKVFASDTNGDDAIIWPVYKCLYCEIEDSTSTFLLSGGTWYSVKRNLVQQVNDTFARIPRRQEPFPTYAHDSEQAYNAAVAAGQPEQFSCHDRQNIRIPGAGSAIEICDLYSRQGEFIHVKRYAASSVLSHHFAQAVVSAEALSLDESARSAFAAQLKPPFRFDPMGFRPAAHKEVLAVVSDQDGDLVLPFFSRLNLRHAQRRLQSMGFAVELAKIEVDEQTKRRKRHLAQT